MMGKLATWIVALAISGLAMGFILSGAAHAQDAAGEWHGKLTSQAGSLRIGLTIRPGADGALGGYMVSPDQGGVQIPLTEVRVESGSLTFAVPLIRGRYEGKWDAAGSAWSGTWTQLTPLPLVLAKGPVPPQLRPQVPAKPYPYREETVTIDSAPGVKLAGTLTIPPGKGPFPAVVLITGSGPQDRDEALMGHRPFLVLADYLTRRGIAVLRNDDRGIGKSTGNFAAATSRDFAVDAAASAAWLRGRPEIDPRHVGLVGHSEGGMIAPMVAAGDPKIAFIVLMAGPGAPIRELMTAQRAAVGQASGVTAEALVKNEALVRQLDDSILAAKDDTSAQAEAVRLIKAAAPQMSDAMATAQAKQLTSAWYRAFIAYDPRTELAKVRVPVLAINGDKDVQVVSKQNLPAIRQALKTNRDVTVVELPGLNHLFQTANTGGPTEYGEIEETMSPKALLVMGDWIVKHARR